MSIDSKSFNPEERQESSKEENVKLFKKNAETILDDQFDKMEIADIVSYFNEEDVEHWNKLLNELSEKIDANKETLSDKEIIAMKAKFIGEMTAYRKLPDNSTDKTDKEEEKESQEYDKGKQCSRCGKLLPSKSIYCAYCGNKL